MVQTIPERAFPPLNHSRHFYHLVQVYLFSSLTEVFDVPEVEEHIFIPQDTKTSGLRNKFTFRIRRV